MTLTLCAAMSLGPAPLAVVQAQPAQPAGDIPANVPRSQLPLADPVVDADAELKSQRTWSWVEPTGTRVLLLENDVSVAVGTYGFRASRAVVRIDTEPSRAGRPIRHLSMLLENAQHLRGRGPTQVQAQQVLVTVSTTGQIDLVTDLLHREARSHDPLVVLSAQRTEQYLARLRQGAFQAADQPGVVPDQQADALRQQRRQAIAEAGRISLPVVPRAADEDAGADADAAAAAGLDDAQPAAQPPLRVQDIARGQRLPEDASDLPGPDISQPDVEEQSILPTHGTVHFSAQRIVFEPATPQQPEPAVTLIGSVRLMYQDHDTGRAVTLTAENAVLFVADDADAIGAQLDAQTVRGVYLEDNVIVTDGDYTVRAPRVFYGLVEDRAVVLDAVMFTWDERRQIPIYVRAERLRQHARTSWSAENALLTTSEFAVPHFSIAARQVTVQQEPDPRSQGVRHRYEARGAGLRIGEMPIFALPRVEGDIQDPALRRVSVGYSGQHGPIIETAWDMFALTGMERPGDVDLLGRVDWLGEHNIGLGLNLDYNMTGMRGIADGYLVPYDDGEDELGRRDTIDFDGKTRGYALWRHRQQVAGDWDLSLEFAYVSDPTFLEEYFRPEAERSKDYETSLYLKRQQDDWAFTFLTSYHLNDFVTQTSTLQYRGNVVEKLPELGYYRVGTSLWDDRLTYYSETRASRVRLRYSRERLEERGFTASQAQRLFGLAPTMSLHDAAVDADVPTDYRTRFDTRHEIQAPMELGLLDVVPYMAGRITLYDRDFDAYSGQDDNVRLWGTVGTRLHTQFSRTFDDVDNRLLDVNRLRHIIEPRVDLFVIGTTVGQDDLPVYDEDIEPLGEGTGVRLGMRQTFQTQRGGPGRWRSVDWLVIDTDFVLRSGDAAEDELVPRYYSYRPEFSRGGNHFHTEVLWMISDTLAQVAEVVYNFENSQVDAWRIGLSMQHTPRLASFADYSQIEPLESRLLGYGFTYDLTRKWAMGFRHTLDLNNRDVNRALELTLVRRVPQWQVVFVIQHDDVDDEQTVGVVLVPEGMSTSSIRSPFLDRMPW